MKFVQKKKNVNKKQKVLNNLFKYEKKINKI